MVPSIGLFALITVITLSFLFLCWMIICWRVHIDMTRRNCSIYGWGDMSDFITEFSSREWIRDTQNSFSYFSKNKFKKAYIHAGVIKFGGMGMTLRFTSFMFFYFWSYKNKSRREIKIIDWKKKDYQMKIVINNDGDKNES